MSKSSSPSEMTVPSAEKRLSESVKVSYGSDQQAAFWDLKNQVESLLAELENLKVSQP
ncbi:hypothetical protein GS597_16095 [Synechococcales cyanobacterium C]|uniref:Uncharacterized protein n=1 Tax=Petrachloros mirabilis ULC683 TaxID=2781853 RepID=A0A8K2A9G0_9CYAN|nr:hypothetical protein [Petrachloros mirabilis]NCJ08000.1 hypothetical protein [Petrachloros mirabilis ULC683]